MEQLISLSELIDLAAKNKAGIIELKYADIDTISNFPIHVIENNDGNLELDDVVEFTGTNGWLSVPVKPFNKVGWSISDKETSQGIKYVVAASGILTPYDPKITKELHKMKPKEFILKLKDHQNREVVLGSPNLPFKFSWSFSEGDTRTNKQYQINFQVELLEPPLAQPA